MSLFISTVSLLFDTWGYLVANVYDCVHHHLWSPLHTVAHVFNSIPDIKKNTRFPNFFEDALPLREDFF